MITNDYSALFAKAISRRQSPLARKGLFLFLFHSHKRGCAREIKTGKYLLKI